MTSTTANAPGTFDLQNTAGFAVSEGDEDMGEFDRGEADGDEAQGLHIKHELLNFDNLEEDEDASGVPSEDPLFNENNDCTLDDNLSVSSYGEDQSSDDDDDEIIVPPSPSYFIEELQQHTPLEPTYKPATKNFEELMEVTVENSIPITSLRERNREILKPAVFSHLDVYRCFICRMDFPNHDHFIKHRTTIHRSVAYDPEAEKAFACGICGRPWKQPREALACAVIGHDPSKLQTAMFCHSCPMCPEDALGFHSLVAVARHWKSSHPEKQVPLFLSKLRKKDDFLPQIKVTKAERMAVSEVMLKSHIDPMKPLVLDKVQGKMKDGPKLKLSFSVFKCRLCETSFYSQEDAQNHCCNSKQNHKGKEKMWVCRHCNNGYQHSRHLKSHLRRSSCNFGGFHPYKCVLCGLRVETFKQLKIHRSANHSNVPIPFNQKIETPFACGFCERPRLNQKEAIICTLYGHNPESLKLDMFRHKCTYCSSDSFGFHSKFELRKHWEEKHSEVKMPPTLIDEKALTLKPFPKVRISLEELQNLKIDANILSLVKELDPPMSLSKYVSANWTYSMQHTADGNNSAVSDRTVTKKLPSSLNLTSKYNCNFCGKWYRCSSSLSWHRRKSSTCKLLYAKQKEMNKKQDRWDTVLKSAEPVDMNLEMPEIELSIKYSETESSPLNEQFQSVVEIGEEMVVIVKEELMEVSSECDSTDDQNYEDNFTGNRIEEPGFGKKLRKPCHAQEYTGDKVSNTNLGETTLLSNLDSKCSPQKLAESIPLEEEDILKANNCDGQLNLDPHEDQPLRNDKLDPAKPTSTATSSRRLKYFNSNPKQGSRNSSRIAQSTASDNMTIASQRTININDKSALKKLFGKRRLRILLIKNEVEKYSTTKKEQLLHKTRTRK